MSDASRGSGRAWLLGACGALRLGADGRVVAIRLGTSGFFVSAVPREGHPAGATLVVRDAAGAAIARRRLSR
jgi:hypothetical protein